MQMARFCEHPKVLVADKLCVGVTDTLSNNPHYENLSHDPFA